jgi:hypothetical protein
MLMLLVLKRLLNAYGMNYSVLTAMNAFHQKFHPVVLPCNVVMFLYTNSSPPGLQRTTWHVETADVGSDSDSEMMFSAKSQVAAEFAASTSNLEGKQLLSLAAKRVWEELFVCKKPVSTRSS